MATQPSMRPRTAGWPAGPSAQSKAARGRRRDYGLDLISRFNRWAIAGAILLTGALSYVADHSFRGHTAGARANGASSPAVSPASSGEEGLQQPSSAPSAPAPVAPPPVVSGGS